MRSRILFVCLFAVACSDGGPFRSKLAPGDRVAIDSRFTPEERAVIDEAFRRWNVGTEGCASYVFARQGYEIRRKDREPDTFGHTHYFPTGYIELDPGRVGSSGLRTIMHELGHAGGLDDNYSNPQSIMFFQNNGSTKLDAESIEAFRKEWDCK